MKEAVEFRSDVVMVAMWEIDIIIIIMTVIIIIIIIIITIIIIISTNSTHVFN